MYRARVLPVARRFAALLLTVVVASPAGADDPSMGELLERLRSVEAEQKKLRQQLDRKDAEVGELKKEVERLKAEAVAPAPAAPAAAAPVPAPVPAEAPKVQVDAQGSQAAAAEPGVVNRVLGRYVYGRGFVLADTPEGTVNFSAYTYLRYLNQKGVKKTYVNGLGQTVDVDRRNDLELNKVKLEFKGWAFDPALRYVLYTWTNNTAQGQGAQVVVGGNLSWVFNEAFLLGGGIYPLPSVRSNEGAWPYFLGTDHRTLTDEFMRGSYTMGLFANGEPIDGVRYSVMLGNNLSILGVDAGQLDGKFATIATALWWMPTTGEYGERGSFGDYDDHQRVATRIGAHFTFSPEDRQEQPTSEDPDNTQIRLSNATNVFTEGALAPGVQVQDVHFYMSTVDAGMKYRGFSLEGEYYVRYINELRADGPLPVSHLFDHGFQAMTSMMLVPKTLQIYGQGAYLFGEYGDPWELTAGINWWVLRRREVRLNLEYIYDWRSPVGYSAIPQALGGTGSIVNANFELYF
jgi:hypothetical protein